LRILLISDKRIIRLIA